MKKFRQIREDLTPQWLRKITMQPKMKKLVRAYLNWRRKNPGMGNKGVQEVIKLLGLQPRDGNQLIDTLNDMTRKGQLPKHLALPEESNDYKYSKTLENFIDGRTTDKSKPGRVKRSGATCSGSVTSLRKRAKASSGEKQKMYHWCANMKSGRSK